MSLMPNSKTIDQVFWNSLLNSNPDSIQNLLLLLDPTFTAFSPVLSLSSIIQTSNVLSLSLSAITEGSALSLLHAYPHSAHCTAYPPQCCRSSPLNSLSSLLVTILSLHYSAKPPTHNHRDPNIKIPELLWTPLSTIQTQNFFRSTHFNQNPLTSTKPDCNTIQPSLHIVGKSSCRDSSSTDRNPHIADNFSLATPHTTNLNLHHGNTEWAYALKEKKERRELRESRWNLEYREKVK